MKRLCHLIRLYHSKDSLVVTRRARVVPLTFPCVVCYDLIWTASSEFGTYRLCEQRRFRRACASAQSRQNLRCSLIQAVNQEERSDRKPDPWSLWMARHAQLKFVMTECSKTQIRLTGLICFILSWVLVSPFLFDFLGRLWNSIVSVPGHCIFIDPWNCLKVDWTFELLWDPLSTISPNLFFLKTINC